MILTEFELPIDLVGLSGQIGENFTTQLKIRTKSAKISPDKNALEPNRVPDGLSGVLPNPRGTPLEHI